MSAVAITEISFSSNPGEMDTGSSIVVTEEAAHLSDPTTTVHVDPSLEITTSNGIYCLKITMHRSIFVIFLFPSPKV